MSQASKNIPVNVDISQVLNSVSDLSTRVTKVEDALFSLAGRLDDIDSRLNSKLDKIDGDLDKMRWWLLGVAIGAPATLAICIGLVTGLLKLLHVI